MSKKSIIKARGILAAMLICGAAAILVARGGGEKFLHTNTFAQMQGKPKCGGGEEMILAARFDHAPPRPQRVPPEIPRPNEERLERLSCFNYLTRNIFLADRNTILLESDVDVGEFLAMDFTLDAGVTGPQVLIFHAHSREKFADSDPNDAMSGVMGVGRELAEILRRDYGIEVLHHTERFDIVDGRPQRDGAYERLDPVIRQILAENPSIQVLIDLHRDGVGSHVAPMVTYIDGERAAQIMFVNGLSRRYRGGEITPVASLPNLYQRENLAFTLNLQLAANELHPGFARRAYLLPFRYSLHMAPA
ncbi:MAG: stage II sporulation protein P, partial [Defluviitaleaceae bacterium]|nr:stage II sporulation protein P [Defluviitaleaceae bacterium]